MSPFHTPEQCVFRIQMRFAHCEIVVPLGAAWFLRSDVTVTLRVLQFLYRERGFYSHVCVHTSIIDRPHCRKQTIVIQLKSYNSNLNLSGSLHVLSNFLT